MRLLLDTHCWLWISGRPERFSSSVRGLLEDPGTELLVSAVVTLEIAIKHRLGKLPLPAPPAVFVAERIRRHRAASLPIDHAHAARVGELPLHHRDPFDRLLVAQAQVDGVSLLTVDPLLEPYDIDLIWADRELPGG